MTPAERARKIEQLEFERECEQARLRAQQYAEQRRQEERRRVNVWLDRPAPESNSPKPSKIRPARLYTYNGEAKTLTEWSQIAGVSGSTFAARLRSGMDFERAVTMRPRERAEMHTINGVSKTLAEWAKYAGCSYNAMSARLYKGRSLAEAVAMSAPLPIQPGVVFDFAPSMGTGAGSTAQEISEITFSDSEVSQ